MDSTRFRKVAATFLILIVGASIYCDDWRWSQYVKPGNSGANDSFGISFDIAGRLAVVGAPAEAGAGTGTGGTGADDGVMQAGAAYAYTVNDSGHFTEEVYIKPSTVNVFGNFGQSVSTDGMRIYVGAPGQFNSGAVYVFEKKNGVWEETAIIRPGVEKSGDFFGYSISSSMNRIIVGAPGDDTGTSGSADEVPSSGAAYIFELTAEGWAETAKIKAEKPEILGGFGLSVAISGSMAIVGSPGENSVFEWEDTEIYPASENGILDAGAVYLYEKRGDEWVMDTRLTGNQSFPEGRFGESVNIAGSTVAIGAPGETVQITDTEGNLLPYMSTGTVYIYSLIGDGWVMQETLTAPNGQGGDLFGYSVNQSGNRLLVGAPGEDSALASDMTNNSMRNSGAAYLFEKTGNRWEFTTYFKVGHPSKDDSLGDWVAMNGRQIILGASKEDGRQLTGLLPESDDNTNLNSGAINIFTVDGGTTGIFNEGIQVSGKSNWINDGTNIVSLESGTDFGKVFTGSSTGEIFDIQNVGASMVRIVSIESSSSEFEVTSGFEEPFFLEPGGVADFLVSMKPGEISGLTPTRIDITFGEENLDVYDFPVMGFREEVNAFGEIFNNPGAGGSGDMFGRSLSITGRIAAAGAFRHDIQDATDAGIVYIYGMDEMDEWSLRQTLMSPAPLADEYFGYSVSGTDATKELAVGAPGRILETSTDENNVRAGAVYLYKMGEAEWELAQEILSSNLDAGDGFGSSLYLNGERLIVGAPDENGGGIAVNESESDNSLENAGAAYIFEKDGDGQWNQTAYLKASNSDDFDGFGWSVAINGSIAVVGAPYESSSANTINGSELNNIFFAAGAAYIFELDEDGDWSQSAYLKPSNPGSEDFFGWSVAVEGNVIAVGAPGEDSFGNRLTTEIPDNGMIDSGAVYLFEKLVDGWAQTGFLKGSARHTTYGFGRNISMKNGRLISGAIHDRNSSPGINPGQVNSGSPDSGAFYIFEANEMSGEWDEVFYVKSPRPVPFEEFGFAADLTEDHVVVSALSAIGNDSGTESRNGELVIYDISAMQRINAQNQPTLQITKLGLELEGDYNRRYLIESGTNLIEWSQSMQVTGTGWGFPLIIPFTTAADGNPDSDTIFFRLADDSTDP